MKDSTRPPQWEGKSLLRKYIRAQKSQYDVAQLETMSTEITNRVFASAWWQEADTLLLYYPLPDEVDVRALLHASYEVGKRVLLPVVKGAELELHFYEGESSLMEGAFGIKEPTGPLFSPEHYDEIELAIIPGMAFDRAGHRLGRGKGYYDRLLPNLKVAKLVGVCWAFQLVDEVPSEPHDISVLEVIW